MSREAAVEAARNGWFVFPCLPGGKRPAIDQWEQRASADPGHVAEAWGRRYRDHNVGIACGPSALTVVDCDTHGTLPEAWREPGVRDGLDVLAVLADRAGQSWPCTYTVRTPTGGWHLYFSAPGWCEIRNSASKIGPLVDVRGVGGYVIGAGSATSAGAYECIVDEPVEELPGWLAALLQPQQEPPAAPAVPPVSGPAPPRLRGIVQTLLGAREGQRNAVLFWSACRAAAVIAEGGAGTEQVTAALTEAAARIGLTGREIPATIRSGLRQGGAA